MPLPYPPPAAPEPDYALELRVPGASLGETLGSLPPRLLAGPPRPALPLAPGGAYLLSLRGTVAELNGALGALPHACSVLSQGPLGDPAPAPPADRTQAPPAATVYDLGAAAGRAETTRELALLLEASAALAGRAPGALEDLTYLASAAALVRYPAGALPGGLADRPEVEVLRGDPAGRTLVRLRGAPAVLADLLRAVPDPGTTDALPEVYGPGSAEPTAPYPTLRDHDGDLWARLGEEPHPWVMVHRDGSPVPNCDPRRWAGVRLYAPLTAEPAPGRPVVTLARLQALGACDPYLARFRRAFGAVAEVSVALCVERAADFDWRWAAEYLLPPAARPLFCVQAGDPGTGRCTCPPDAPGRARRFAELALEHGLADA